MLYTVLVYKAEEDETGFWAKVAELPGCYTQGETIEEVQENVKDAIETYLDGLDQLGQPRPAAVATKFEVAVAERRCDRIDAYLSILVRRIACPT